MEFNIETKQSKLLNKFSCILFIVYLQDGGKPIRNFVCFFIEINLIAYLEFLGGYIKTIQTLLSFLSPSQSEAIF